MGKKDKIRANNRKNKEHEYNNSLMVMNMLRCVNIGYMYYQKGCFDNVKITLNDKSLIDSISFSKEKVPEDKPKEFMSGVYRYINAVMDKIKRYSYVNNIPITFLPEFSNKETLNVFNMFQYRFDDIEEFDNIVTKLRMDKFYTMRYVIVTYRRMIFGYDLDFLNNNMNILENIVKVCYSNCELCKKKLDNIKTINQCTGCTGLCCMSCYKKCPFCLKKI